jgi:hypothetical protein
MEFFSNDSYHNAYIVDASTTPVAYICPIHFFNPGDAIAYWREGRSLLICGTYSHIDECKERKRKKPAMSGRDSSRVGSSDGYSNALETDDVVGI